MEGVERVDGADGTDGTDGADGTDGGGGPVVLEVDGEVPRASIVVAGPTGSTSLGVQTLPWRLPVPAGQEVRVRATAPGGALTCRVTGGGPTSENTANGATTTTVTCGSS